MNIDEDAPRLEVGNNNFMSTIKQGLANGNLFTLPHLPTRKTQKKEPLIDYSQSHVVTLNTKEGGVATHSRGGKCVCTWIFGHKKHRGGVGATHQKKKEKKRVAHLKL